MMDCIRTGTIRLQISNFLIDGGSNVYIFRVYTCQNSQLAKFDLENLGKGHGVQHSKWSSSMANIDLYKLHT